MLGPQRREDGLCRGAIPAVALWPRHDRQSRKTVSLHRDVGSVTWAGNGCQQVQEETEACDDLCQASGQNEEKVGLRCLIHFDGGCFSESIYTLNLADESEPSVNRDIIRSSPFV